VRTVYDALLVEDDRVVQEAAARILRQEALRVDRADDVASAVARLRAAEHRIVLSDLALPGFSGFDLLDRLASDHPQIPVVLITGYATIENALRSFQRGAFDFLPKPFDVAELTGVARRALGAAAAQAWDAQASIRGDAPATPAPDAPLYGLGRHAWTTVVDGVATIGVAETFPGLVGEIHAIRLPRPGELVTQGLACAEIATAADVVHRVWAPLGGTVLESNVELASDPELLNRAPFSSGWLVRVAPTALEEQLGALTLRTSDPASRAAAAGAKEKRWSLF
jgi:CheY-like chemotaxis protein/glycine cleavage system H lipoate-binding protein